MDVVIEAGYEPALEGYSGFEETELAQVLREHDVDAVTVVGLATDYCVRATSLEALREGFAVTVERDGVRGIDVKPGDSDAGARRAGRSRGERRLTLVERLHAGLRHWYAVMGQASDGARTLALDGVTATLVPVAPDRSYLNAVTYDRPGALAAAYDEVAAAYEEIGAKWTVWVPPADREAVALLERAGHVLDANPRDDGPRARGDRAAARRRPSRAGPARAPWPTWPRSTTAPTRTTRPPSPARCGGFRRAPPGSTR